MISRQAGRRQPPVLTLSGMALATGNVVSIVHARNRRLAPCRSRSRAEFHQRLGRIESHARFGVAG